MFKNLNSNKKTSTEKEEAVLKKSGFFSRMKNDTRKLSTVALLLFLLAIALTAAFALVFVKYAPKQSNSTVSQASTRAVEEATAHLKSRSFDSLSYPAIDIMRDGVLFSEIFNSENFITSAWDCTITSEGYLLKFSGVPRCLGDIQPSNISASFEMPTSLNGVLTLTSFSLSFADGAYHLFTVNDATPSDRYKSLVRTQNAFETHICTLFPHLANDTSNSTDGSSHKAFVL